MNAEIKTFYFSQKRSLVRRGIIPGNSRSLWSAVSLPKDIGPSEIPNNMYFNGNRIREVKLLTVLPLTLKKR